MLSRKIILLGVGFLSFVFCISATAALAKSSGLYLEGGLGYGKVMQKRPALLINNKLKRDGLAWFANLGYKFNENLALEAGGALFAKTKFKVSHVRYSKDNYYYDAALKGIVPFNNGFAVFLKGGGAMVHTKIAKSYSKAVFLYGGGFDFAVAPRFLLTLQAIATTRSGKISNIYAVMAGVRVII